jgi:fumarate hydratase subunit beta
MLSINVNELNKYASVLKAGDRVLLSGEIYTARDAAHKKFIELFKNGQPLPFNINGAVIYYAGPTPAPDGLPIGSCGPTTSGRMDSYAPLLLDKGLKAMIGKGERNEEVIDAIIRNKAVYFCAVGGAGALYAKHITSCEVIAFNDLGCESVKRLTIKDFPLITAIDSSGGNIFVFGPQKYKR